MTDIKNNTDIQDDDFEVLTYEVKIEPHPNADRIEVAKIGDFQSIVAKKYVKDGDIVAYIPTDSIVPDELIKELGLEGKLAGGKKNRVKPIRLRGVFSEGLVRKMPNNTKIGINVAEELGIKKYHPFDKRQNLGAAKSIEQLEKFTKYDPFKIFKFQIKNIKFDPYLLKEGEEVIITEKLHGTWHCMGLCGNDLFVTSKGLGAKGLWLLDNEYNDDKIRFKLAYSWLSRLRFMQKLLNVNQVYVLGEIYGTGIQDLSYDLRKPEFKVFDILIGNPSHQNYLSWHKMNIILKLGQIESVPLLYKGPFKKEKVQELTDGQSTICSHMKEGIVIKAEPGRKDMKIGRVIQKSISEEYLLRKRGTEYQ